MKPTIAHWAGREVEYQDSGGKGTTIVLVNGSGGPLISWHGIFDPLSQRYRVIAYNRPGIGKSSPARSSQTASQMAYELNELLEHLSIGKVIVVGHSLGGFVALQFCVDFPQNVRGLFLLEPSTAADVAGQKHLPTDPKNPFSELNHVRESAEPLRDLSRLPPVPTVVAMGTKIGALHWLFRRRFETRRDHLRQLAQQIPGSEIVEFPNSGHFPQITEPHKVTQAILQLVDKESSQ